MSDPKLSKAARAHRTEPKLLILLVAAGLCCAAFGCSHFEHYMQKPAETEVRLGIICQGKVVGYDPGMIKQDSSKMSSEATEAVETRLLNKFANIGSAGEQLMDNNAKCDTVNALTGTFEDVYGLRNPQDVAHRPERNTSGANATKQFLNGADLYGRSQLM